MHFRVIRCFHPFLHCDVIWRVKWCRRPEMTSSIDRRGHGSLLVFITCFDSICYNIIQILIACWVAQTKYLGIHLLSSRKFKCPLDQAECSYFPSVNAISGRVSRFVSVEVELQLTSSKCLLTSIRGWSRLCGLGNRNISCLEFVVNRDFSHGPVDKLSCRHGCL